MRKGHHNEQILDYFWIRNNGESEATITLTFSGSGSNAVTVYYVQDINPNNVDRTNSNASRWAWTAWNSSDSSSVYLRGGSTLYFYGEIGTFNSGGTESTRIGFNSNSTSNNISIGGNLMSLFNGHNFVTNSEFSTSYTGHCAGLFHSFKGLVDASELVLPAKTLNSYSYAWMFRSSAQLKYPPKMYLDTINANSACKYMFASCTSLLRTPALLANSCTGWGYSYDYMFNGCSSLSEIRIHMLTWGTNNRNIFSSVASSGIIYMPAAATWNPTTYKVPSTWTVSKTL